MRSTKKALIISALCTALCVLLLVSGTVAWFSATKESQVNEIYSGNLDVRLYYSRDMTEWKEVTPGTNDIFKVKDGSVLKDMLWEPGATNVVYLKVRNEGSLRAKYDLTLKIAEEIAGVNLDNKQFRLSEYIMGGCAEAAAAYGDGDAAKAAVNDGEMRLSELCVASLAAGTLNGAQRNTPDEGKTYALVLYLPENVGDETNYKTPKDESARPRVSLKLRLVATQMTGEYDSFGDKYDESAVHPDLTATTAEDFVRSIDDAKTGAVIGLTSDISLKGKLNINKDITIVGSGSTAIENYPTYIGTENKVTFKNMSFDKTNGTEKASSVYAKDFRGTLVFDGCTFGSNKWEAVQITPAGDCAVVFKDCTFNGENGMKRFIHIEPIKNNAYKLNVTVTGCTFNNCDMVNYGTAGDDLGTVIDFDYFADGSTVTMGGNRFNKSIETAYALHPYFCTADGMHTVTSDALLGYLQGNTAVYKVTASGLNGDMTA